MPASEYGWIAPILSPVLVMAGWIIVNAQNNHRENRKEIRASLEILYKKLEEVEQRAIRFHTQEAHEATEAQSIQNAIQRVITRTNILAYALKTNTDSECKNFRKAITLHNFDKTNHRALNPEDDILRKITDSHDHLYLKLEEGFYRTYYKWRRKRT